MDVMLNWLWQGAVIAAVTAAVLRLLPRSHARARGTIVWAAAVIVALLPAIDAAPALFTAPATAVAATDAAPPLLTIPSAWWSSSSLIAGAWMAWIGIATARLLLAVTTLRRARTRCHPAPATLDARLPHWSQLRRGGRQTRLVISSGVRAAAVLGCGRPVIALAPALLTQLPDADLDRIVLHEWAHVQRRDDLSLLAQRLLHVIAGWHPALWWLARQIDLEREAACDAMVVAVTGSAKAYASCLVTVAAMPFRSARLVPGLTAIGSTGVRQRVRRVLVAAVSAPPLAWRSAAVASSLALATLSVLVVQVRAIEPATLIAPLQSVTLPDRSLVSSAPSDQLSIGGLQQALRIVSPVGRQRPDAAKPGGSAVAPVVPVTDTETSAALPAIDQASAVTVDLDVPQAATGAQVPAPAATAPVTTEVTPIGHNPVAAAPDLSATAVSSTTATAPPEAAKPRAPWTLAADASTAVARKSQSAAVATAGFFTRFGKKIAGSF